MTFRIKHGCEQSIWIGVTLIQRHLIAITPQLRDHFLQIVDAEIHHERLGSIIAEISRILGEGREHCGALILVPGLGLIVTWNLIDAEILVIPGGQRGCR